MRVGVIAVGNRFAGDDAVGPLLLDAARGQLPADVVALELDGEPARLLDAWQSLDAVVLVDATVTGAPVGTVHRVVETAVPDPGRARHSEGTTIEFTRSVVPRSTHGPGVASALGLGRVLGRVPGEVVVIGIEGARFTPGADLSREVSYALPAAVRAIRNEVARLTAE